MASIEKRGNRYRAIVSYHDIHGARKKVSSTFDTKRAATAWATEKESMLLNGQSITAGRVTFPVYFRSWIENNKRDVVRASTYTRYVTIANVIDKNFQNAPLESLTTQNIQQVMNEYGKNHSQKYIRDLIVIIRSSLKDALAEGLIKRDIFSRLTPRGQVVDKKRNWLDEADMLRLRRFLYAHKDEMIEKPFYIMALIALESGLRVGEIQGLNIDDFGDGQIRVTKAYSAAVHRITEPKSRSARRQVAVPTSLLEVVEWYFDQTAEYELVPKKHSNGKVTLEMRDLLFDAEVIRAISFHGLRHTHVSYLLHKGIEIEYISKRVGHSDVTTTMQYYAHMLKEKELAQERLALEVLSEL